MTCSSRSAFGPSIRLQGLLHNLVALGSLGCANAFNTQVSSCLIGAVLCAIAAAVALVISDGQSNKCTADRTARHIIGSCEMPVCDLLSLKVTLLPGRGKHSEVVLSIKYIAIGFTGKDSWLEYTLYGR
jgi:hypothetical protein